MAIKARAAGPAILILAAACAALAGCASAGNSHVASLTPAAAKHEFVRGHTTEAQVRSAFGDPQSVEYTQDGSVQWKYAWVHSAASGADFIPFNFHQTYHTHAKTLTLLFDAHGLLEKYELTDSEGTSCGGIGC